MCMRNQQYPITFIRCWVSVEWVVTGSHTVMLTKTLTWTNADWLVIIIEKLGLHMKQNIEKWNDQFHPTFLNLIQLMLTWQSSRQEEISDYNVVSTPHFELLHQKVKFWNSTKKHTSDSFITWMLCVVNFKWISRTWYNHEASTNIKSRFKF